MPQPNFRVVDNEVEHPRDRARREMKRFRTNAEREKLGICNQHTDREASRLSVDEVLKRGERDMPEVVKRKYRVRRILAFSLITLALAVAALILAGR